MPLTSLPRRRDEGRLRGGPRNGASQHPREPEVPVPVRELSRRRSQPNKPYRISDLDLASRLSFFLWSSIPDDELMDVAVKKSLHKPEVLQQQVRRMLADPRSQALVENFAGQWLYIRNVADAPAESGSAVPLRRQPA